MHRKKNRLFLKEYKDYTSEDEVTDDEGDCDDVGKGGQDEEGESLMVSLSNS